MWERVRVGRCGAFDGPMQWTWPHQPDSTCCIVTPVAAIVKGNDVCDARKSRESCPREAPTRLTQCAQWRYCKRSSRRRAAINRALAAARSRSVARRPRRGQDQEGRGQMACMSGMPAASRVHMAAGVTRQPSPRSSTRDALTLGAVWRKIVRPAAGLLFTPSDPGGTTRRIRMFRDVVTSVETLRGIVGGEPSEVARRKELSALDAHARTFIARSPFLLLGTSSPDGRCDVSPKGDAPGFVHVLDDHHLVIPDRPGNKRLDGMRNILANPHVGVIFLVPGNDFTLRVNGRAAITREPDLLSTIGATGKRPQLDIGVEVE